jgi:peptide chain release factor 1
MSADVERLVEQIVRTRAELSESMADPDLVADRARYAEVHRRWSGLTEAFGLADAWSDASGRASEAAELLTEGEDPDVRALLSEARAELDDLGPRIREAMVERDPDDDRDTLVEIRPGAGGEEAALFARDLVDVYTRYAESRGLRVELISATDADAGGLREATIAVKGTGAFAVFKHEAGVHRVQRVPATESQGRIHTSAATVAVLPEAEEVDVQISDADLKIDVYRSSGPGGQSVNTTDSAVRITHLPTGLVVTCQDEKSQHKNRDKALGVLRSRLLDLRISEQEAERARERKLQVGTGDRSAKIRTYNFPQSRVTDHRIGYTTHALQQLLDGELDELVGALKLARHEERAA